MLWKVTIFHYHMAFLSKLTTNWYPLPKFMCVSVVLIVAGLSENVRTHIFAPQHTYCVIVLRASICLIVIQPSSSAWRAYLIKEIELPRWDILFILPLYMLFTKSNFFFRFIVNVVFFIITTWTNSRSSLVTFQNYQSKITWNVVNHLFESCKSKLCKAVSKIL